MRCQILVGVTEEQRMLVIRYLQVSRLRRFFYFAAVIACIVELGDAKAPSMYGVGASIITLNREF
jgi:hypothetical protein